MLKHIVTRTASSALNRVVEGAWFVAGVTGIIAERAFSAAKSTASALGVPGVTLMQKRSNTVVQASSVTPTITEFFEPLEDLSDLEVLTDDADEDRSEELNLTSTTEPEVPALVLTASDVSDDSDAVVARHLEDLVALYPETLENDLSEDGNAPF